MLTKIEHGEVLELRLERPPVNALHHPLVKELRAAVEAAPKSGAKALVLSGVSGMYSAGLDVPWLLDLDRARMLAFWDEFFGMLRSVALSPIPVAAAITGHSPAGGAVIAIYCDIRIAAQGKFKIGLNEVQVGLPVPRVILGGLTRLVGQRQAERLAVRGMLVSPEEALACGLVDQVVAPEEVVPKALEWCRELLKMPPHAMSATRKALRADYVTLFDSLGATTRDEMTAVWFGAETQAALKTLVAQLAARKK
ncbi:MAG TPA: enoyl-CoA hydratase/isomerase family protein [Gammaproteobacteria bacterium]|jgi:enoyl-CoA hydratase/carnithine racemase